MVSEGKDMGFGSVSYATKPDSSGNLMNAGILQAPRLRNQVEKGKKALSIRAPGSC